MNGHPLHIQSNNSSPGRHNSATARVSRRNPSDTAMPSLLSCTLTLPPTFRPSDILAFHRRDAHEVAESVREASLRKGLVWNGLPGCLELHFQSGRADATLTIDGAAGAGCAARRGTATTA